MNSNAKTAMDDYLAELISRGQITSEAMESEIKDAWVNGYMHAVEIALEFLENFDKC